MKLIRKLRINERNRYRYRNILTHIISRIYLKDFMYCISSMKIKNLMMIYSSFLFIITREYVSSINFILFLLFNAKFLSLRLYLN